VLEQHASRSRHISTLIALQPAAGGLRSQVFQTSFGSCSTAASMLQQAGRRERTRSFDRRLKAGIDLAASAIDTGPSEPQLTSSGRATRAIPAPAKK
jgi:hypothetical protein